MTDARAFWVTGKGVGEIRTESLDEPGPGRIVVRSLYSAVSRGTESLVFENQVPASQFRAMRAPFQAGEFPAPVKYGYINVGRVEAGGSGALVGREVFCLYPHQDRYVVPEDAVSLIPAGVPAARAVLAANMETAINALWDSTPRVGARVAVVGAGVVGCLAAYLTSRTPGCRVQLVDIDERKAAVAEALGIPFAKPEEVVGDADLVIHASGVPAGLATSLLLAGVEATVLEMSWYGDQHVPLPLGEAFHSRRLVLKSTQVGSIAPAMRARWSHGQRMALALSLLKDETLDCLITGESRFEDLPETMAELARGSDGALCHRIKYST